MKATVVPVFCALVAAVVCYADTPPVLYVSDGTNSVTLDSSGASATIVGTARVLSAASSRGSVSLLVTLGSPGFLVTLTGTNPPSTSGMTVNDLSMNATSLGGTGNVIGRYSVTNYFETGTSSVHAVGGNSNSDSVVFTGFVNGGNAECTAGPCTGIVIGPAGPLTGTHFDQTVIGPAVGTSTPYSLTSQVVLTVAAPGATTGGDFAINVGGATGCPATKGFWKNHGFPSTLSFPVTIGGISYSAQDFKTLLSIPTGGNAVLVMGSQLVAAIVSEAAGGEVNSSVLALIANAENLVNGINMTTAFVPSTSTLGKQMTLLSTALSNYDSAFGNTCPEASGLNFGN